MPVYDYLCGECGPFTDMRPMAECDLPSNCPGCKASAPRVMLTAPQLMSMSSARRQGFTATEANAGSRLGSSHAGGCSCCTGMRRPPRATGSSRSG